MKIRNALRLLAFLFVTLFTYACSSFSSFHLMSWEEYVRQSSDDPYVLELDSYGGKLVYYGAFHKVDPEHPQFEDIERRWDEFQPTFAYCEGNIWPLEESRIDAIENYGEQGLVTYLAARDGIQVECIDPPLKEQAVYLKNFFPPHLIKAYYVLRQAAINRVMEKDTSPDVYASYYLRHLGRIYGQNAFPSNLLEFESMASILFPGLDDWEKIPRSYFGCPDYGGFLADIHRKLNKYRDRVMIQKITGALKKGNRIFAIVGRSHVVIQEAALKSFFSSVDSPSFHKPSL